MSLPRAVVSWSGGKDCSLALYRARERFDVVGLVTMFTRDGGCTRSHGLRPEVVEAQAQVLGLPLICENADWNDYESRFEAALRRARQLDITHAIFGDIFPATHHQWAEAVSERAGLIAVEPLWSEDTARLAEEFIASGGVAKIVTVRESCLDGGSWLGRELDRAALDELRSLGLDPGGENGEYHTVVTRFAGREGVIALQPGKILEHGGCQLLDMTLDKHNIRRCHRGKASA